MCVQINTSSEKEHHVQANNINLMFLFYPATSGKSDYTLTSNPSGCCYL